ncbi:hypothetical protein MMC08_004355 [Hypocenomyce scalaris]|nr:hypothetical protein [Hypocenomyce scalaris]
MWILECDGKIFQGKRIWLRPGKKYLFGRTKQEGGRFAGRFVIDHKSVSRKHLTLSVSSVKPGEGSLVHTRSEITLEDEDTKIGTTIDGEKVKGKGQTKILKNDEHVFKLGSFESLFKITWQPVVLSFSFSGKELKGGKDPLIPLRSRLEDLDIKAIIPYIIDKTTHVVASKRNTAKGLQALINGKYIVADSFVDAVVYAATPGDLDEPESLSPLEEDFDANWPDALQHLPPRSKEPSQRPSHFFSPNPQRANVFEGYTFIFCDKTQFDNLQAPITNGSGKALLFMLDTGKTTAKEIVRYVKDVAGEKGLGEFEDGSEGKGVVIIRFRGAKDSQDWAIDLGNQVALALDQRLIEQGEFLDAILTNDPSILRRPLPEEEDEGITAPPPTAASAQSGLLVQEHTPPSAQPEVSQRPARRNRTRGTIAPLFKGFDDGFDVSSFPTPARRLEGLSQMDSVANGGRSQRDSHVVSFLDSQIDVDPQASESESTLVMNSKKRSQPSSGEDNEDEMVESLLPAAAAMKRRKLEEQEEARRRGVASESSFGKSQKKAEEPEKKTKPRREINIQEVVRERREAEEEAARRDEESLKETLEGMDIEQTKSLAVIEEMEISERRDRPLRAQANGDADNRWDKRWNGRKNFKKFRRRGDGIQPRRGQSVIVPLEEVKKKDFGIGDEYWLESEKSKKKRKEKERASQSQSTPYATAVSQQSREVAALEEDDADMPEVIDVEAPRTTRLMDRTSQLEESSGLGVASGKRPASASGGREAKKRQKILAVREEESESEDELKFRFKRKR